MREAELEKYFREQTIKRGGISYKWVSPGQIGVPDRIHIKDGKVTFVELKTEKGKLGAVQERVIKRLRDNGANAVVLYGIKQVDQFLLLGDIRNANPL